MRAILVAALLLAGCGDMRERRMANHAGRCEGLGFQPRTEGHARCVLDLERDYVRYFDQAITAR
jgi:hypothetical protein